MKTIQRQHNAKLLFCFMIILIYEQPNVSFSVINVFNVHLHLNPELECVNNTAVKWMAGLAWKRKRHYINLIDGQVIYLLLCVGCAISTSDPINVYTTSCRRVEYCWKKQIAHFSMQLNCWSLRCSWSIACRRCSNYIFILHLTLGLNILHKDNCKPRRETFKLWDLVRLIFEILRYIGLTASRLIHKYTSFISTSA